MSQGPFNPQEPTGNPEQPGQPGYPDQQNIPPSQFSPGPGTPPMYCVPSVEDPNYNHSGQSGYPVVDNLAVGYQNQQQYASGQDIFAGGYDANGVYQSATPNTPSSTILNTSGNKPQF